MKRIGSMLAASAAVLGFGAATAQQAGKPAAAQTAKQPVKIDRSILHVQVILDHLGFSPGVLDGRPGMSLTAALKGFQESRGMKVTGEMDRPTLAALHQYRSMRPTRARSRATSARRRRCRRFRRRASCSWNAGPIPRSRRS